MATTALRDATGEIADEATAELVAIWALSESIPDIAEVLHEVLPSLVDLYGSALTTLAAEWYDDFRFQQAVEGEFFAIPADILDSGTHALVGWAEQEARDMARFQSLIEGGIQRRIADFARDTIQGSAIADPKAIGWQRIGNGACAFCQMLIARGAVYTEAGAAFGAHDNCKCSVVPAFGGKPLPVRPYTPSTRNITDADRARVREWLRANTST